MKIAMTNTSAIDHLPAALASDSSVARERPRASAAPSITSPLATGTATLKVRISTATKRLPPSASVRAVPRMLFVLSNADTVPEASSPAIMRSARLLTKPDVVSLSRRMSRPISTSFAFSTVPDRVSIGSVSPGHSIA